MMISLIIVVIIFKLPYIWLNIDIVCFIMNSLFFKNILKQLLFIILDFLIQLFFNKTLKTDVEANNVKARRGF